MSQILVVIAIVLVMLLVIACLYMWYAEWSLNNTKSSYALPAYATDFYKYVRFWITYYSASIAVSSPI